MRHRLIVILLVMLGLVSCNLPDEAKPDLSFLDVLAITPTAFPAALADTGQSTPTSVVGDAAEPGAATATVLAQLGDEQSGLEAVPSNTPPPVAGVVTDTPQPTFTHTTAAEDVTQEPTYTPPVSNPTNTSISNPTATHTQAAQPTQTSTQAAQKAAASNTPAVQKPTNTSAPAAQPTNTQPPPPNTPVPQPTNTPVPQSCSPSGNNSFESQLINLINQERTSRGIGTLSANSQLTTAALNHSEDMACNDFFSHTGSNGSTPWARMAAAGYSGSAMAENIAAGQGSAQQVFDGWMNSSGHRDNMLNPTYTQIGMGYRYTNTSTYGSYTTATFGSP